MKPQPGPQSYFLASLADIAIYGGAAGGGKTFGLLIDPLREHENSLFNGVIFRRSTVQVRNPGGLWDESMNVYPHFGAIPRNAYLEWVFPSGMQMKFAHLEHEMTVLDWQGSQIPYIGFDELTHFSEKQFWYMLSRNRSMSGVPGRVRASCNPDFNSWVRKFIDWWIGIDGLPIKSRSGVIRWFIRVEDKLIWADSKKALVKIYGPSCLPMSLTFIPSSIYDNQILMEKDPSYLARLKSLSRVERERLLGGNWNVRASAGNFFRREWFPIVKAIPAGWSTIIRYWDRAATKPSEENPNPDWSVGLKLYVYPNNTCIIADVRRWQDTPLKVEGYVKNVAGFDGVATSIGIEQEPGAAGVADVENYTRLLAGYDVRVRKPTKDKTTRAKPVSAQCEAGNISILEGAWNEDFFTEVENFSEDGEGHDDQVDCLSGAFNEIFTTFSILDAYG